MQPTRMMHTSSIVDPINYRYAGEARREIANALRDVNWHCDELLASTGCPMDSFMERLEERQRAASAALDGFCRPYRDAGGDLPPALMALLRNRDKIAEKLRTLRALQPLRAAGFDAFEQARTPQEADAGHRRILQGARTPPFSGLEEID